MVQALMSPRKDSCKISLFKMPMIDSMCLVALVSAGALQTAPEVKVADARGRVTFHGGNREKNMYCQLCYKLSKQKISSKIK